MYEYIHTYLHTRLVEYHTHARARDCSVQALELRAQQLVRLFVELQRSQHTCYMCVCVCICVRVCVRVYVSVYLRVCAR